MRAALLLATALLLPGCRGGGKPSAPAAEGMIGAFSPTMQFVDVAKQAGVHWRHVNGRSGRFYFPETMGSGCTFLDYNGDGRLDLFLVNSSRLPGFTGKGPYYSALYRNDGIGHFTDVTQQAGLAVDCYGMGVAVGDYDNDGHPDLYLTALGPNHLFHNNGNGTFTDVTARAGVGDPRFSSSATFFDYNRDGYLDLFVCNYCDWTPATNRVCHDSAGRNHMCNPSFFHGSRSTLYRNRGDRTFAEVTQQAGVSNPAGKALGVTVFDGDGDGFLDLLVANDLEPNAGRRPPANRLGARQLQLLLGQRACRALWPGVGGAGGSRRAALAQRCSPNPAEREGQPASPGDGSRSLNSLGAARSPRNSPTKRRKRNLLCRRVHHQTTSRVASCGGRWSGRRENRQSWLLWRLFPGGGALTGRSQPQHRIDAGAAPLRG
jgi:hypothetical protein